MIYYVESLILPDPHCMLVSTERVWHFDERSLSSENKFSLPTSFTLVSNLKDIKLYLPYILVQ